MPELGGLEAAQLILQGFPATCVIILTTFASEPAVREGLRIGIRGFVAKTGRSEGVLEAIKSVSDGKTYIGSEFANPGATRDLKLLAYLLDQLEAPTAFDSRSTKRGRGFP